MLQKLNYSTHALKQIGPRGIRRRWVDGVVRQRPTPYGRQAVIVLPASHLFTKVGASGVADLRVVIYIAREVIVTVHRCEP